MKTITIQSEFASLFSAYETMAVTSKGVKRIRCISLDKDSANRWAEEDNKHVPYYDESHECTVYHVRVNEITICLK